MLIKKNSKMEQTNRTNKKTFNEPPTNDEMSYLRYINHLLDLLLTIVIFCMINQMKIFRAR